MDEIDEIALARIGHQRVFRPYQMQAVPADVRHLVTKARRREIRFQRADAARQHAKARVLAVLIAFFKQKLHAKADSQQRLAVFRLPLKLGTRPVGRELFHRVAERADPGQDDMRRLVQLPRACA